MKITLSGVPVGGVAEAGVWVGATKIKSGGTATVGGDRVYYQGFSDARMHSCKLDGSDDVIPDCPSGIALIVASSTVWAAWTAGSVTATSWGQKFPNAVPMAATEDGAILLLTSYNTGKGLRMVDKDGEVWHAFYASPQVQYPYPQAFALDRDRAVYLDVGEGRFNSWGLPDPKQVLGLSAFDPFLIEHDGEVWLGYHTSDGRALLHPIDDASKGYVLAEGDTFGTTATGDWFGYSRDQGESQMVVAPVDWSQPLVELKAIQPPPPPPFVDEPIGPRSEPLPVGSWITVADYFQHHPQFWPRGNKAKGDTHGMDMQPVTHKGQPCLWFAKFDDVGKGRLGELLQIDAAGNVHLLADCSNEEKIDVWSDTLWLPNRMQIGRQFGAVSGGVLRKFRRSDGALLSEQGWSEENWLEHAWPAYYFGKDIGTHPAIEYVYNNTGVSDGHTTDVEGLHVEKYIVPLMASWADWASDEARKVFATNHFVWPAVPKMHSQFCYLGGKRYPPDIPSFIPIATVPEVPPMSERNLTTAERATIDAFGANFPPPQYPGPGDAPESWQDVNLRHAPNGWVYKLAQQMAFSHGSGWGQKRRGPGAATSNGTIALKDTGTNFHAYDLLESASTGRPKLLGGNGSYYYVDDGQEWLSVPPFNHLGDQKPRPGRAPWPASAKHGVSGFDVAPRVHGGDMSYYNLTAPLPLNCFVYTTIDHPATHRLGRTFAQGLVQTESLLIQLTANHRQAIFIMICGPHTANNGPKPTRAEILDMVKQQVALFVRYPKAVLALSLGNELYQQGFEAPEMLDPTLWAEVDALVPLEFPFAIGQVGDAVVFGPGSFAAMHPDRGKSSADALQILADAQAHDGRTVVAREPKRIEVGNFAPTDQASGDLNFVKEELANARRLGLPYFLHLAAGRGCHVPAMDQVQHDALALLKAAAGAVVTPPGPPVPPITPPGSGHPVLDVNLRSGNPSFLSHAGYNLFVFHRKDVEAEAEKWYRKATGHAPADSDLAVMVYVRGVAERDVWGTLREAWKNGLPNGEP